MTGNPPRRRLATWLPLVLALALALPITLPAAPSLAGTNASDGWCLKAYNYADPGLGYLYASTEAVDDPYGSPCDWAHASIANHGSVLYGPSGTEGTECAGSILAIYGAHQYASVSTTLSSSQWRTPCSRHASGYQPPTADSLLGMYFSY
jgi:hypothetical protein